MSAINNIKDVRAAMHSRVYWDEPDSARWLGRELSGIITDAQGKNVYIDGNWKWRPDLKNLRTDSKVANQKDE